MGKTIRVCLFLILALTLAACGSSKSSENGLDDLLFADPDGSNPGDEDAVYPGDDVVYPTIGVLEYFDQKGDDAQQCQGYVNADGTGKIDHCTFYMTGGETRSFRTIYMEEGVPKSGRKIVFEVMNETGDVPAALAANFANSDAQGVAGFTVTAGQTLGHFSVKVHSPEEKLLGPKPLYFDVEIQTPDTVLQVKFKQQGTIELKKIQTMLFVGNNKKACGAINPAAPPKADFEQELTATSKVAVFNQLGPKFTASQLSFSVLALGFERKGTKWGLRSVGCIDGETPLAKGETRDVVLSLVDLPPSFVGIYKISNYFDFLSALPPNVKNIVDYIITFLKSPSGGILTIACDLGGQGVLATICGYIFNDPENPSIDDMTGLGGMALTFIDGFVQSLLQDNVGGTVFNTAGDVASILTELQIDGTLEFKAEPDSNGYFAASKTYVQWTDVYFQWTLGETCDPSDPTCGLRHYGIEDLGQDNVVSGTFEARVVGWAEGKYDQLEIKPFSINFKYGAFLNFVLEKLVLPAFGGEGVDSYDEFIMSLLGGKECVADDNCCETFAAKLSGEGGIGYDIVVGACNSLIPMVAGYLRNMLANLSTGSGEYIKLQTPTDKPCLLKFDFDNYRLDKLGSGADLDNRCHWTTKLTVGGKDVTFDASFFGVRQ